MENVYEILKCLLQIKSCKGERPFAPTINVLHSFLYLIVDLEARLRTVTQQRDELLKRFRWLFFKLETTRLCERQRAIKTQLELEIALLFYQTKFDKPNSISYAEQNEKLTNFPLRGVLIG